MTTQYTELAKRVIFMLLACVILTAPSAADLCERRCTTASPALLSLKQLWARLYNNSYASFEHFIQMLVSASNGNDRLNPLRRHLRNLVINYRECIITCEHQFSKRSPPSRYTHICRLHLKKHRTRNLPSGIRKYCHDNQVSV